MKNQKSQGDADFRCETTPLKEFAGLEEHISIPEVIDACFMGFPGADLSCGHACLPR